MNPFKKKKIKKKKDQSKILESDLYKTTKAANLGCQLLYLNKSHW